MDTLTRDLAEYCAEFSFDRLTSSAVEATKLRLLDSLGCVFGGSTSEPVRIARSVAEQVSGPRSARTLVYADVTTPGSAAFINTAMVRYLDFNDSFIGQGGIHPSDAIPALVAVGEATGKAGTDLIAAVALAYDIIGAFSAAVSIRERGWDQGLWIGIAVAAAASRMLGGDVDAIGQAISLSATANVPTRQTRAGELSMWKGCATGAAARSGLFLAELALAGMTGPDRAFDGRHGLFEQATGPLDVHLDSAGSRVVERSHLKLYPSEFHSQAPLNMAAEMRRKLDVRAITKIDIATYWAAYSEIGSEAAKWSPRTRETADHSLPFLVATMLRYGVVWTDSFSTERLDDPELHRLMACTSVREDPAYTARFAAEMPCDLEIVADGVAHRMAATLPRGHAGNPLSSDEVTGKLRRLVADSGHDGDIDKLAAGVATLDEGSSVTDLVDFMCGDKGSHPDGQRAGIAG